MRSVLFIPAFISVLMMPRTVAGQYSGIGIKGGLLMSDTRSGKVTTNMLPGATAGVYFPLRADEHLEIQPELVVSALGAGYTLPDGERSDVRTLYVQLPVSAKYFIGNAFNLQAGALMGRLMLAQQDSPDGRADVTESYQTWDYGIVLGLGADLITGLDIDVRYYNGMRPVLVDDEVYFPRNRAFMLTLGYRVGPLKPLNFTRKRG